MTGKDGSSCSWWVALLVAWLAGPAGAAEVSNPSVAMDGNRVAITYDLDADGPAPVTVKGSEDGGRTWTVKMGHLTGDVGDAVRPGRGKRIEWDVLADYPAGYGVAGVIFELTTSGGDYTDPVTGMEFVWVEGGCFEMGQSDKERRALKAEVGPEKYDKYFASERPVHEVCVDGFFMGKTEVTNAQYRRYKVSHDSGDDEGNDLNGDTQPVVRVSWNDAVAYAKWLSQKTGKRYRLPTEAHWEYAARAGTTTARYWGDDPDEACRYANVHDRTSKRVNGFSWEHHDCDDGYAVTAPVGSFEPNGWGLYDMLGNVWEWTADRYGKGYYADSPRQNPMGPSSGSIRVIRGGGWYDWPSNVRSAARGGGVPGPRLDYLGFRLVLSQ